MTPEDQRLINAILAFDIDGESCELMFEQRLARKQQRNLDYPRRVSWRGRFRIWRSGERRCRGAWRMTR